MKYGGVKINKSSLEQGSVSDGDASFAGAQFTIRNKNSYKVLVKEGNTKKSYGSDSDVAVMTTDSFGNASIGAILQAGTYEIRETKAPSGYKISDKTVIFTITNDGEIVDKQKDTYPEEVIRAGFYTEKRDLELNAKGKTQGDITLEGAEFSLVNRSSSSVKVDGKVFKSGEQIAILKTDIDGVIKTSADYLPYGTYELKELTPPEGFTKRGKNLDITFSVREEDADKVIDLTTADNGSKAALNEPIRFDLTLIKFQDSLSSDDAPDQNTPMEGVRFDIYLKSELDEDPDTKPYVSITTDEDGVASTVDRDQYPHGRLPYGMYIVREAGETVPEGITAVKDFILDGTVTGNVYDGKEYKGNGFYLNDHPVEAYIELRKADTETGETIPLQTEFQILNEEGEVMEFKLTYPRHEKITNFVTDETGCVVLPQKLPYGTYYIHEVNAPDGYLRGNNQKFTVTEFNTWENAITVTYHDQPAKGKLVLTKADADTMQPIGGAVFSIFAEEDIVTGDGTLRCKKDELVDTIVIGTNGIGESKDLYLGNYYIQEIKAPSGYCLNTTRIPFTLTYQDQETPVVEVTITVMNKPTTLMLLKSNTDGLPLNGIEFEISRQEEAFTIMQNENTFTGGTVVTDEDGVILQKYIAPGKYVIKETKTLSGYILDTECRYFVVDENGYIFLSDQGGTALDEDKAKSDTETITWSNDYTKWEFSKTDITGNQEIPGASMQIVDRNGEEIASWISKETPHRINCLPAGEYTLIETQAPEGYAIANSISFTVTEDADVHQVAMCDKQVFMTKTDVTGDMEIPGAEMRVIDQETGVIADHWTSGETPHSIEKLVVGKTYILEEVTAPVSYVKASSIEFTVTDNQENQSVKMVDQRVFMSKTDITGEKEIPGASIIVTEKESDDVVDEWTSGEQPHAINGLEAGKTYQLHETAAPDGYVKSSVVEFTVTEDGTDQTVTMTDKQVFVSKRSVTGEAELQGAELSVSEKENGNVVDTWISTEAEHAVSGLEIGKTYVLTEVTAPEGYIKASSIEFTVDDELTTQRIVMVDQQVFMTKTDVTGENEVPGASITVTEIDSDAVIDEWISDEQPHAINGLEAGKTYQLHETAAPNGYVKSSIVEFTVTEDRADQTVSMTDKQVFVSKRDVTGEAELPGAELTVSDKETGDVVDTWTSDENEHAVSGLEIGKTYVLTEVTAPEGYVKASSIEFTVADDLSIQQIIMVDKQVFMTKTDVTGETEVPGASITVSVKDSAVVIDEWISGEQPHAISGLEVGKTYQLHEVAAPNGYVKASTVEFTVTDDGVNQTVHMTDKQVFVSKKTITGDEELPGAHLTIKESVTGEVIDEWTSSEEMHPVSGLEVLKSYLLTEAAAPDGYAKAESITFTVADDGTSQIVEMKDDVTKLYISKVDFTSGKELPGAALVIKDQEGNTVEEWTSTETPHYIEMLPVGEYTLTETKAPDGYVTAETITFHVKDTGEIQTVTMKDKVAHIRIHKKDIVAGENGKELPGAHLIVKNADGKVIDEWTSTKKAHDIEMLPIGKYTLTEVTAPNGYEVAEVVTFNVNDSGEIQHVTMYDSPKEETVDLTGKVKTTTITPTYAPGTPGTTTVVTPAVKTGDDTPLLTYLLLMLISCTGIIAGYAASVYNRKKQNTDLQ